MCLFFFPAELLLFVIHPKERKRKNVVSAYNNGKNTKNPVHSATGVNYAAKIPLKLTSETFPEVTELDNLPIGKSDSKSAADVGPEPTATDLKPSLDVMIAYSLYIYNNIF